MDAEKLAETIELIRRYLSDEPGLREVADAEYSIVFQWSWVPCCAPVNVLLWINPESDGLFLRLVIPSVGPLSEQQLAALNAINFDLPAGGYAADPDGELRFKTTLFFGERGLDGELLGNLISSAGDMVRSTYASVMRILLGREHQHL